jgi:peptide-methionine (S)-S-oxide reductase
MWFTDPTKLVMPAPGTALPGRADAIPTAERHFVNGASLAPPDPPGSEAAIFGMGCFWGAERLFWQLPGVLVTSVGYAGGQTPNPTYEEVCTGRTGHAEVVRVVFDPDRVSYAALLRTFWEQHDPTQGMRQGNDVGTQYRSVVITTTQAQRAEAEASRDVYQRELTGAGLGRITTGIEAAGPYYFAEDYHQQYLAKDPNGYDCHTATGVACPMGVGVPAD